MLSVPFSQFAPATSAVFSRIALDSVVTSPVSSVAVTSSAAERSTGSPGASPGSVATIFQALRR